MYVAQFEYVPANLHAHHDRDNVCDHEKVHDQKNAYVHNRVNVHALDEFEDINNVNESLIKKKSTSSPSHDVFKYLHTN